MELVVSSNGVVRCLYEETLSIASLGALRITRASHVEPDAAGKWRHRARRRQRHLGQ